MIIQTITPVPVLQASGTFFRVRNVTVDLGVTACANYDILDANSNILYSGQSQMNSAQYSSWGGNDIEAFQTFASICGFVLTGQPVTISG